MTSPVNVHSHSLRDLLGMRGVALWLMLALVMVSIGLLLVRNLGYSGAPAVVALGFAVIAAGAVLALCVPGDSVALGPTLFIVACCPAGTALTLIADPVSSAQHHPALGAYATSYVLPFLAIRGRLAFAWFSVLLTGIVIAVVCQGYMDSLALAGTAAPLGSMAGASALTLLLRPAHRTLLELRDAATARAATEATIVARRDESSRQLARLDAIAAPALARIATGEPLDEAAREECRLLEAELRDGLRAPQLAPELAASARAARARGVDVLLLDDGGFTAVPDAARDTVLELAITELATPDADAVTIRVLPPRRRLLATVLVAGPELDRRVEVDAQGLVRVCPR